MFTDGVRFKNAPQSPFYKKGRLGVSLDIENYCTLRLIFNRKS